MKSLGPRGAAGLPSDKLKLRSGGSSPLHLSMEQRVTLTGPGLGGCSTEPEFHIILIEPWQVLL